MEERVVGSFIFKLTNSGNLIGEYFNNHQNTILSESANRISNGKGFEGQYTTSWLEGNTAFVNRLTITRIIDTNIFTLEWSSLRGVPSFRGKATMIEENMIYGYYSGEPFIQENN